MKTLRLHVTCVLILGLGLVETVFAAQPPPLLLQRSTFVRPADPAQLMKAMWLAFPIQNQTELDRLVAEQQDPNSPNYHRWLTPEEFGKRFGASEPTYQRAVEWLTSRGLHVTGQFPNRLVVFFDGTAAVVEQAFGVHMGLFQMEGKTYYSNDRAPQLPPDLQSSVLGVFSLDNFPKAEPAAIVNSIGPAMGPSDMWTTYNLTSAITGGLNGGGQNIAVIARTDFNISDVTSFRSAFSLPANPPQKIFVGANPGNQGGGEEDEVLLDAEWSGAMAPLATIKVIISSSTTDVSPAINYVVNNPGVAKIASMSFSFSETTTGSPATTALSNLFQQATAQGQTFFASSGDTGAVQPTGGSSFSTSPDISFLCASPFLVCVGGTRLTAPFDGSGNVTGYGSETAWTDSGHPHGASGGGASHFISKPGYQAGTGVPNDGKRDVPDVSILADPSSPGVFIFHRGAMVCCVGGTSLSSPLWAGIMALANQASGGNSAGWANPRIYQMGQGQFSGGPVIFHDITTGNNNFNSVSGFAAGQGYDLVTGWGTPDGDAFVRNFASSPTHISVSLPVSQGGANTSSTLGTGSSVQAGYATVVPASGVPYGTAVFSSTQNGVVVSEAGVPASPPSTAVGTFIDFRTGVPSKSGHLDSGTISIDTGFAVVNRGTAPANLTFKLRGGDGSSVTPDGHAQLGVNAHAAMFIDQLSGFAPDFVLPPGFSTSTRFATLTVTSDQPVSFLGLRLTNNQRGETLLTSTPVAGTQSSSTAPAYFPQLVDGGGYHTTIILTNNSSSQETGTMNIFSDAGAALPVRMTNGQSGNSFPYNIPPNGFVVFQTDGSLNPLAAGSVQVAPTSGPTPTGAAVLSLVQGGVLVTETGVPSATPTTHALIYVDTSSGHNTGVAIAAPGAASINVTARAFQTNGTTPAGSQGAISLPGNGHTAKFAGEIVPGLPNGFTGVLDLSSATPFVALTLRSLSNARGDFLITTFPIADFNQTAPSPIVFPQIADGGGYKTQFILLSTAASTTAAVTFFGDAGNGISVVKRAGR